MILNNILENIGQTPIVKINKLLGKDTKAWIKLERNNPEEVLKTELLFR